MTEIELVRIVENEPDFLDLVTYFVEKAAKAVAADDINTPNHAQRITLAPQILDNVVEWARKFAYGVVTNATIAARVDVADILAHPTEVEFEVNAQFDAFALIQGE